MQRIQTVPLSSAPYMLGVDSEQPMLYDQAANSKQSAGSKCCNCCGTCLVVYLVSVAVLCLLSLLMPLPAACAVQDFDLTSSPTPPNPFPMIVGTDANIANGMWTNEIDLTGIWWIRWNDADGSDIEWYNSQLREILVTFGETELDMTKSDGTSYPWNLLQFGQLARRWGYSNFYFGWVYQMFGHLWGWSMDTPLRYDFVNSTFATIDSIGTFIKKSPDEWLRPTELGPKTYTYTLTRVLNAAGQPVPQFWPLFQQWFAGNLLRIWGNDNRCARECELMLLTIFVPRTPTCKVCAKLCD